jgi:hypothetical protein
MSAFDCCDQVIGPGRRGGLLAGFDHPNALGELALELARLGLRHGERAVGLLAWREADLGNHPLDALAAVAAADFGFGDLDRLAGLDSELLELFGEDRSHRLAHVEGAFFSAEHRLHAAELAFDRPAFGRAQAQLDRNVGLKTDGGHYLFSLWPQR